MKRLTLLRHAKSSWGKSGLADHDRPLDDRGLHDAPRMGKVLADHGLQPTLLLVSSALRTRQTAEMIAPAFRNPVPELRIVPAIYLASPGDLLAILAKLDDSTNELVLIGHNPGMTLLANTLLPDLNLDNLPTAGAVAMECRTDSWSTLDAASSCLRLLTTPKLESRG